MIFAVSLLMLMISLNFSNRAAYRSYYDSDYTTIGKIDLRLAAGKYKIIFTNQAAWVTNKMVTVYLESQ